MESCPLDGELRGKRAGQGLRNRERNEGGRVEIVGPATSAHIQCLGNESVEFNADYRLRPPIPSCCKSAWLDKSAGLDTRVST